MCIRDRLGIRYLLSFFVPDNVLDYLGIVLLVAILGFTVFAGYANLKRNHHKEKLQTTYYKAYQIYTKAFFHIFQRPANYLSFIFLTNISFGQYFKGAAVIFFPLMIFSGYSFFTTEGIYLIRPERLYQSFERLDRTQPYYYKDELIENELSVFAPVIESKKIYGNLLEVFIPVQGNESDMIDKVCGEWPEVDSLSRDENRKIKYDFYLACYHKYHRVYLNDSLYQVDFVKFEFPYKRTEGILTYLPIKNLPLGKNLLTIEKVTNQPDSTFRTFHIPFWIAN